MPTYLSKIGERISRYNTWKECISTIRGIKGVQFRKCQNAEEEQRVIEQWQIKDPSARLFRDWRPGPDIPRNPPKESKESGSISTHPDRKTITSSNKRKLPSTDITPPRSVPNPSSNEDKFELLWDDQQRKSKMRKLHAQSDTNAKHMRQISYELIDAGWEKHGLDLIRETRSEAKAGIYLFDMFPVSDPIRFGPLHAALDKEFGGGIPMECAFVALESSLPGPELEVEKAQWEPFSEEEDASDEHDSCQPHAHSIFGFHYFLETLRGATKKDICFKHALLCNQEEPTSQEKWILDADSNQFLGTGHSDCRDLFYFTRRTDLKDSDDRNPKHSMVEHFSRRRSSMGMNSHSMLHLSERIIKTKEDVLSAPSTSSSASASANESCPMVDVEVAPSDVKAANPSSNKLSTDPPTEPSLPEPTAISASVDICRPQHDDRYYLYGNKLTRLHMGGVSELFPCNHGRSPDIQIPFQTSKSKFIAMLENDGGQPDDVYFATFTLEVKEDPYQIAGSAIRLYNDSHSSLTVLTCPHILKSCLIRSPNSIVSQIMNQNKTENKDDVHVHLCIMPVSKNNDSTFDSQKVIQYQFAIHPYTSNVRTIRIYLDRQFFSSDYEALACILARLKLA